MLGAQNLVLRVVALRHHVALGDAGGDDEGRCGDRRRRSFRNSYKSSTSVAIAANKYV